MNEIASPVVKNFAQIVSGNLTEAIESTTQENWHETLAMILTYAKEDEFIPLCQALSEHLATLHDLAGAILCSICAVDISSLLRLGLQFTKDTRIRSNLAIIEVILILCSMISPQDLILDERVQSIASKLGVLCEEMEKQGMTSIQSRFLQLLKKVPSAQDLVQQMALKHPDLLPGYTPVKQFVQQQQPVQQFVQQQAPQQVPQFMPQPAPQPVQQFVQQPVPQFMPQPVPQQVPQPAPQPAPRAQPKPFIPTQPIQPIQPVQPIQPIQPAPRQPVPFIPSVTPIIPTPMQQVPSPTPAPEPQPEVEYPYFLSSSSSFIELLQNNKLLWIPFVRPYL